MTKKQRSRNSFTYAYVSHPQLLRSHRNKTVVPAHRLPSRTPDKRGKNWVHLLMLVWEQVITCKPNHSLCYQEHITNGRARKKQKFLVLATMTHILTQLLSSQCPTLLTVLKAMQRCAECLPEVWLLTSRRRGWLCCQDSKPLNSFTLTSRPVALQKRVVKSSTA